MRFLSHDLRSPLASIITLSQLLQDPYEPPSPAFSLARIEAPGRQALNLADDFLRLSPAETLHAAAFRPVALALVARHSADQGGPVARASPDGTGLGLVIVKTVVERHGGGEPSAPNISTAGGAQEAHAMLRRPTPATNETNGK